MAPWLGRRYSVEELDDADRVFDEDRPILSLVRAYEVPGLLGTEVGFGRDKGIADSLHVLLHAVMPGVPWALDGRSLWGPLEKYGIVHTSIAAPADEQTGQPMSLEICANLVEVDGFRLDTPEGEQWIEQNIWSRDRHEPLPGSGFKVRLIAATYANVACPGVGVPFYM